MKAQLTGCVEVQSCADLAALPALRVAGVPILAAGMKMCDANGSCSAFIATPCSFPMLSFATDYADETPSLCHREWGLAPMNYSMAVRANGAEIFPWVHAVIRSDL